MRLFPLKSCAALFLAVVALIPVFHPSAETASQRPAALSVEKRSFQGELKALDESDPQWVTLRREIADNLSSVSKLGRLTHPLRVLKYHVKPNDRFFPLMARLSQNEDTLASLNGLLSPSDLRAGTILWIPNARGIFRKSDGSILDPTEEVWRETMLFIPGARFSLTEDKLFHSQGKQSYLFPLDRGHITSRFGMRKDPIHHDRSFHGGIDIGAPLGSAVKASKDGSVLFAGAKGGYGKLIILRHSGGYVTYYGHLSSISVKPGEKVRQGKSIGRVGSTGRSTGPHLHFEIRKGGVRQRPEFARRV